MRYLFPVLIAALTASGATLAQVPAQPGSSFTRTFAGLCVRRMEDLEALRRELKAKGFPTLQQTAASAFLGGRPGDAWPIPEAGAMGNLVLLLPADRAECSVLARRGPTEQAEAEFQQLATNPVTPVKSELKIDRKSPTAESGEAHTLGYMWMAEGQPTAAALFLTTASSPSAPAQLKATITRVANP